MAPRLRVLGTTALIVRWRAVQVLAADSDEMKHKVEAARKDLKLPPKAAGATGRRSKKDGGFNHKWHVPKPKPRPGGGGGRNVF